MENNSIKQAIASVAAGHEEIKLAYLFGSTARNDGGILSDVDIALYLDGLNRPQMAELKLKLITKFGQKLKTDRVDLVILNTSEKPELKYQIISEGELVYEQEPYKVIVEPRILNEYFDFQMILKRYGLTCAQ